MDNLNKMVCRNDLKIGEILGVSATYMRPGVMKLGRSPGVIVFAVFESADRLRVCSILIYHGIARCHDGR